MDLHDVGDAEDAGNRSEAVNEIEAEISIERRVDRVRRGRPQQRIRSQARSAMPCSAPWTQSRHAIGRERAGGGIRPAPSRAGWIEGRTVTIDYRWAEGRSERFGVIAAEFVPLERLGMQTRLTQGFCKIWPLVAAFVSNHRADSMACGEIPVQHNREFYAS